MAACTYCGADADIFKSVCDRCILLPEHERVRFSGRITESFTVAPADVPTSPSRFGSDPTIALIRRAILRNALLWFAILSAVAIPHYLEHGHFRPAPGPKDGGSFFWAVVVMVGPILAGLFGLAFGKVWSSDEDGLIFSRSSRPKEFWDHVIFWFAMSAVFSSIFIWNSCGGR
jgi:hypothetical protein